MAPFVVDPNDPRAPSQEQWDAMTSEQRTAVVEQLPALVPIELMAPEGDRHRKAKERTVGALDAFFRRIGRKVYLSSELAVYYPDQSRFVPDVLEVLDVETHDRDKWVVCAEGKGPDLILEVHVAGDWRKVIEDNARRSAQLGIPEYFVFDRGRMRLAGMRLSEGARTYRPILPQHGLYESQVLNLSLGLEEPGRLRFFFGTAPLLEAEELIQRAQRAVDEVVMRKEEAEQQAEQERQRADQERQRAEARIAELQAELDRLRERR